MKDLTPEQRVGTAQERTYIETSLRNGVFFKDISREFADKIHDFMNANTEPEDEYCSSCGDMRYNNKHRCIECGYEVGVCHTEPEDEDLFCQVCGYGSKVNECQITQRKIKEIIDAIEATGSTKPITLLAVVERLQQEDK